MNNEIQLSEVSQAIVQVGQFVIDNILTAIITPFREHYQAIGSPYGDTDEGFLRWLKSLEKSLPDYR